MFSLATRQESRSPLVTDCTTLQQDGVIPRSLPRKTIGVQAARPKTSNRHARMVFGGEGSGGRPKITGERTKKVRSRSAQLILDCGAMVDKKIQASNL